MSRAISVSEAGRLFDCEQQWDFSYGGHTTGSALKPKETKLILREGRAWGAGVAAWHATGELAEATGAIIESLDADADQLREHGFFDESEHEQTQLRLRCMLNHYVDEAERLDLFDLEREFRVPLPSRSGRRRSNRYVFVGLVDGLTRLDGRLWIVEFKLRKTLTSLEQVAWARQIRWYAWAVEQELNEPVAGVIVDERLNAVPKVPRMLKGRATKANPDPAPTVSHAKDQMTTVGAYRSVCLQAGEQPSPETVEALACRRWQERHRVTLRRDELERAGRELVSAAQLLAELDNGRRWPVANPSPFRCPGCSYREICNRAHDSVLIDALFERTVPKRQREEIPA